jgi:transcriptional regulator with XRE-family HTH domain
MEHSKIFCHLRFVPLHNVGHLRHSVVKVGVINLKRFDSNSDAPLSTTSLGDRIKAVRLTWRWSQEEMAEALRVDQASISFWERDKIKPSGSAIVALASLFRTSTDALEGGLGFKVPDPPSHPESAKVDREFPRSVSLPAGTEDVVMVVDLGDGSSRGKQLSEAMMSLVQGVKDSRRVWVVLE